MHTMQAWDSSTRKNARLRYFEKCSTEYQALPDAELPNILSSSSSINPVTQQILQATQLTNAQMQIEWQAAQSQMAQMQDQLEQLQSDYLASETTAARLMEQLARAQAPKEGDSSDSF
eukprot:12414449-Karenia_brevis.AAC.1